MHKRGLEYSLLSADPFFPVAPMVPGTKGVVRGTAGAADAGREVDDGGALLLSYRPLPVDVH